MGFQSNVRFALQRRRGSSGACRHVDQIRSPSRRTQGCEKCIALGDTWVHLRMCMTCGEVGCCDSSKNRHAHRHADDAGHPIARSVEPGEDWMWCFVDEAMVDVPARK